MQNQLLVEFSVDSKRWSYAKGAKCHVNNVMLAVHQLLYVHGTPRSTTNI